MTNWRRLPAYGLAYMVSCCVPAVFLSVPDYMSMTAVRNVKAWHGLACTSLQRTDVTTGSRRKSKLQRRIERNLAKFCIHGSG